MRIYNILKTKQWVDLDYIQSITEPYLNGHIVELAIQFSFRETPEVMHFKNNNYWQEGFS